MLLFALIHACSFVLATDAFTMTSKQIDAALEHLNNILPEYTTDLSIPIVPWGGLWQVDFFESRGFTSDIDIELPFFRSVAEFDTTMAFLNAIAATSRSPCIQELDGDPRSKATWINLDVGKALPALDITNIQTFTTTLTTERQNDDGGGKITQSRYLHIFYRARVEKSS